MPALRGRERASVALFEGATGALPANSATALLGGPGSGKSSLLKALAGLLEREPSVEVSGEVFLAGRPVDELHAGRAIAYVAQDDAGAHYPSLTVRETLHFASLCQIPRSRKGAPMDDGRLLEAIVALDPAAPPAGPPLEGELRELLLSVQASIRAKAKVELIIEVLGLGVCADTVIGDGLTRGISGGQRRRVTLAEKLVSRPGKCLLADEITTGLDSASAAAVCAWTAESSRIWNSTCLVSLLQPDPAALQRNFNSVVVMAQGRVVFHGPPAVLVRYFEQVTGAPRGDGDPCEWVLTVVEVGAGRAPEASAENVAEFFAEAYARSDLRAAQLALVEELSRRTPALDAGIDEHGLCRSCGTDADGQGRGTALTFSQSLWVLLEREALLKRRSFGIVRVQLLRVLLIAVVGGVLFYQIPRSAEGAVDTVGAMFFAVNFFSFGAMPQMAQVLQWKHILVRQRNDRWFSGGAYGLVAALMTVPFTLLEVIVFTPIFYFMAGFTSAGFGTFLLVCFLANMAIGGLFRFLGAACPNLVIASSFGSLVLLLFIVTSGFTIVRTDLPPYLLPVYYLSPFAWGLRAVAVGQLLDPSWNAQTTPSGEGVGQAVLAALAFGTDGVWVWAGIGALAVFWVVTTAASCAVLSVTQGERRRVRLPVVAEGEEAGAGGGEEPREGEEAAPPPPKGSHAVSIAEPEVGGGSARARPLLYTFDEISYAVDISRKGGEAKQLKLLHSVSGFSAGGTLTALMGPSGAGKTTLLDVLARRKTYGTIDGTAALNGRPLDSIRDVGEVCAYVEQFDSLWALATVEESVAFVARLRLARKSVPGGGDGDGAAGRALTRRILSMLELQGLSGALVASLSMEARKRCSIALELVTDPEVLFLDEPTSSLDSKSAGVVAASMRLLADAGKVVICTIHQPSTQVFACFDQLLLLQKGGRVAYFGPSGGGRRGAMARHFEGGGGSPLPSDRNPSAWVLDVLAEAPASEDSWSDVFQESSLRRDNDRKLQALRARALPGAAAEKADAARPSLLGRSAGALGRTWDVCKRSHWAHWRNPQYTVTKMLSITFVALIYGITYIGQGKLPAEGGTTANIQNIVGLLYSSSLFTGVLNCNLVLPVQMNEREVFYRESKTLYGTISYGLASLTREMPYLAAQAALFVTLVYWMAGFSSDSAEVYLLYALTVFLIMLTFTAFGQLLAVLTPSRPVAQVVFSFVITFWNAFAGFAIPVTNMSPVVAWIWYICPTSWSLYSLAASQLGDSTAPILPAGGGAAVPANVYLEERFGYRYDFRWWALLILVGFNAVFSVLFLLALRFVNWQLR